MRKRKKRTRGGSETEVREKCKGKEKVREKERK